MRPNANRLVVVIALLLGGCQEPTTRVGSACKNGVCPQRTDGLSGEACLFSATSAEISISGQGFVDICLPSYLPLDTAGLVPCEVHIGLPSAVEVTAGNCTAAGFLPPDETRRSFGSSARGRAPTCVVPQLDRTERANASVRGWYYRDDNSEECTGPGASAHFTENTIPDHVNVFLDCWQVLTVDDEGVANDVDSASCSLPVSSAGNADVGESCMPLVPARGFDDRTKSLATGAGECASGACLVYQLRGDPSPDCVPEAPNEAEGDPGLVCTQPEEAAQRVYCSCRCSAPEGDPGELCTCPDEFTCVDDVVLNGPPGVRGGYCVRNGTFTTGP